MDTKIMTLKEVQDAIEAGVYLDIQDAVQWYGVQIAEWTKEDAARPCNCGSGYSWVDCPGNGDNPSYCG